MTSVSVDFSKPTGVKGSPYVFDGQNAPIRYASNANVVDYSYGIQMPTTGVNMHRFGLYPNHIITSKTATLSNFQNNIGNKYTDWGTGDVLTIINSYCNGHQGRDAKFIVNIAYIPSWLSCSTWVGTGSNGNGTNGYPKDMNVWANMCSEMVKLLTANNFIGSVLGIEIWNEPSGCTFLDLTGSPFPAPIGTRSENWLPAYCNIYQYAVQGIRSVNKTIPIGGCASGDVSWSNIDMGALLQCSNIANDVNFTRTSLKTWHVEGRLVLATWVCSVTVSSMATCVSIKG